MDKNWFDVLYYAVAILGIVLCRFLIPWAKIKLGDAKDTKLVSFITTCMNAAESIFKLIEKSGDEKKAWVIEKIKKYAEDNKLNITDEQIDLLIQALFTELDGVTLNTNK